MLQAQQQVNESQMTMVPQDSKLKSGSEVPVQVSGNSKICGCSKACCICLYVFFCCIPITLVLAAFIFLRAWLNALFSVAKDLDELDWTSSSYNDDTPSTNLFAMGVDPNTIVVYGKGCGATFAHQVGTAFSADIKGQILDEATAYRDGSEPELSFGGNPEDTAAAEARVNALSASSDIDSTTNLQGTPIYTCDSVYEAFYNTYQASVNVDYCSTESQALRDGLKHVYGAIIQDFTSSDLNTFSAYDDDWETLGHLVKFNQDEFGPTAGVASAGYFYYPKTCVGADKNCDLVMVFAPREQSFDQDIEQQKFVYDTGMVQAAAANDLVMVFPFYEYDESTTECFDVTGTTGVDFDNKNGEQMKVIEKIVERLVEAQDSTTYDYDIATLEESDLRGY